MIRGLLIFAGSVIWFVSVFLLTWWMTFPSDALLGRAQYFVSSSTNGSMTLNASSISPWWTGVKAHDFQLISVDPNGETPPSAMVKADSLRFRAGLLGLISDDLSFSGSVDVGAGRMTYSGNLVGLIQKRPALHEFEAGAYDFPLSQVFALLEPYIGDAVSGEGNIDVALKLKMPDGLGDSNGKLTIKGENLALNLSVPDPLAGGDVTFDMGPVQISDLDLKFDIDDGRVSVDKGRLISDQVSVDMSGDMSLEDEFSRSRMRFKFVLSELGDQIEPFSSFMSRAKWDDDKYHYSASCRVSRLNMRCFRPDRKRKSRTRSRDRSDAMDMGDGPDMDKLAEDRERRRRERAERRKNRTKSRARRPGEEADEEDGDERGEEDLDSLEDEERGEERGEDELPPPEDLPPPDELPPLDRIQPNVDDQVPQEDLGGFE